MKLVWPSLALVVCLLAFVAIGWLALQPGIPPMDTETSASLHGLSSPWLDALMAAITGLGSTGVLVAVALSAAILLALRGHRLLAASIVVALLGTLILNDALKQLFARARPGFDWAEVPASHSFPSGHAMNSFVVYVALASITWRLRGPRVGFVAIAAALALVLAIGASRVYLGVHWPSDVVGGFVAGAAWLLVLATVMGLGVSGGRTAIRQRARPEERVESLPPSG